MLVKLGAQCTEHMIRNVMVLRCRVLDDPTVLSTVHLSNTRPDASNSTRTLAVRLVGGASDISKCV